MTSPFYERQRALAIDWRDMVVEAMEQQTAEQDLPVTDPESAELADMVDKVIDQNIDDWKKNLHPKVGVTRNGVVLAFPDKILLENLRPIFIERLNAVLPLPFRADDLKSRAKWKDHFEITWLPER